MNQENRNPRQLVLDLVERSIKMCLEGHKRIDLQKQGIAVCAYWAGTVLRIDVKHLSLEELSV